MKKTNVDNQLLPGIHSKEPGIPINALASSFSDISEETKPLRVVFAGTPEFAALALETLLGSSHEVIAVFTQPDRQAGRGLKIKISPVKSLALMHHLPLYQPVSLGSQYEWDLLSGLKADVMVVAAFGMLLPARVLSIPHFGCINIHPSLLPRWRGAAPIQRAIYAGDSISGVTIMQMDPGLDTGPILLQQSYILEHDETAETLHDKLATMGGALLVETLNLMAKNKLKPTPQDNALATYAHKISKEEALIDWSLPAIELEHTVRAFNPTPVAHTSWHNHDVRIWQAKAILEDHSYDPRTIVRANPEGLDIATGDGILRLLSVQLPGAKVISIRDFYNSHHKDLITGQHFI